MDNYGILKQLIINEALCAAEEMDHAYFLKEKMLIYTDTKTILNSEIENCADKLIKHLREFEDEITSVAFSIVASVNSHLNNLNDEKQHSKNEKLSEILDEHLDTFLKNIDTSFFEKDIAKCFTKNPRDIPELKENILFLWDCENSPDRPKETDIAIKNIIEVLSILSYYFLLLQSGMKLDLHKSESKVAGFNCTISEDNALDLMDELVAADFIDSSTQEPHFLSMLGNHQLPSDYKKIEWIDLSGTRKTPNKSTLYTFIYSMRENGFLNDSAFDTAPSNKNNLYRKLERLFQGVKNLANSNPHKLELKQPRQQEIHKMISKFKS